MIFSCLNIQLAPFQRLEDGGLRPIRDDGAVVDDDQAIHHLQQRGPVGDQDQGFVLDHLR